MRVVTNPPLTAQLRDDLVALWTAVADAGGAVGVVGPATVERVAAVATPAFARVEHGLDDLVVAFDDAQPVGLGFLETNDSALTGHWGTVRRLQRAPSHAGRGVGAAVLAELERAAVRRGLTMITLTVRGGTGRERFYAACGYRVDGLLPARLRMDDGTLVDEWRLSKVLDAVPPPTGGPAPVPRSAAASWPTADAAAPRESLTVLVERLDDDMPLPRYARPGDAGLDLFARESVTLKPGDRAVVPTGVALAIPHGHVGLVHPRSGLAVRHGLSIVNAPGTVDAGYRGEIKVVLVNTDLHEPVTLDRGTRIAQLVVQRVETVALTEVAHLPHSERASGGFGSTGR